MKKIFLVVFLIFPFIVSGTLGSGGGQVDAYPKNPGDIDRPEGVPSNYVYGGMDREKECTKAKAGKIRCKIVNYEVWYECVTDTEGNKVCPSGGGGSYSSGDNSVNYDASKRTTMSGGGSVK